MGRRAGVRLTARPDADGADPSRRALAALGTDGRIEPWQAPLLVLKAAAEQQAGGRALVAQRIEESRAATVCRPDGDGTSGRPPGGC